MGSWGAKVYSRSSIFFFNGLTEHKLLKFDVGVVLANQRFGDETKLVRFAKKCTVIDTKVSQ